ncbi:MAG: JAB domain-containing protein, partial [Cyclobacteriaceae bacterium]
FIRSLYEPGTIELKEEFITLYLNNRNQILGYHKHSVGGMTSTVVDMRLVLAVALKSASTKMILAHNHPSSNTQPSQSDIDLTKQLKEAATVLDIKILDHLIITKDSYYSLANKPKLGLEGIGSLSKPKRVSKNDHLYVAKVGQLILEAEWLPKSAIEKMAASFGITDKTVVKELTELAIVQQAREIARNQGTTEEKYRDIVNLYQSQVNLSHRTSLSIMLQQYSTPAPIALLAGIYTKAHLNKYVFEPSAGNGLLTIAANPRYVVVNEVDDVRRANLEKQGYLRVMNQDATEPFTEYYRSFEAVLTNPPFGKLDQAVKYETFPIKALDHLMALRALDTMQDHGRAAIIIGGHTAWDTKDRIQSGKNRIFFNYLYSRYDVQAVLNIDGKLYARQGAQFPVRLILIAGRKPEPAGAAPLKDPERDTVIKNFDTLYERVMELLKESSHVLKARALKLKLAMLSQDELGAPYRPSSDSCIVLDTQVPDSMEFEAHSAAAKIKEAVGGSMDAFVKERLHYPSERSLCLALSAEQIDA